MPAKYKKCFQKELGEVTNSTMRSCGKETGFLILQTDEHVNGHEGTVIEKEELILL